MDAIRDRAEQLLRSAGGWLSDDALTRALFGGSGPAWQQLLLRVLDAPRFVRTPLPDAGWRLGEGAADEGTVAVAIETTGQDPARAALVQIAACRIVDGQPGPCFHALVLPPRRLPDWLAGRLGVDPTAVDDALPLGVALERLAEFVGGAALVAWDAGWTLRFLNAQCQAAGRPLFTNRAHDLLLAAAALTGEEKPALARVAARLGIPLGRRHRGAADAVLVAQLALRLAAVAPRRSPDRLLEMARAMPDAPGVYCFRGGGGELLYVGKAKRLRRRVLSYLTQPVDRERDLSGLRLLTAAIEWEAMPDDLAAALREMELIAAARPRFNTQRRVVPGRVWVEAALHEPFPRLRRVAEPGPARFGPYPSAAHAERAARLAASIFRLRTCARKIGVPRRTKPRPPCRLLEQGRCLGPCTGTVPADAYARLVTAAAQYLSGEVGVALRELQARLAAAAARGDRAESDWLRGLFRMLLARSNGERRDCSSPPANVAVLLPAAAPERAYVVVDGMLRWHGPLAALSAEALADVLPDEAAHRGGIIVRRWLAAHRGEALLADLPPAATPAAIVERIRSVLA
ncbi:MAG: hypothetical protein RMM58_02835 [Chloroflexota bacterium]|nr:hypothetical protein [Dehalococcoidia bacterium]MDW8252793.1 hypothetical protein [Chloroflexota bacterium]